LRSQEITLDLVLATEGPQVIRIQGTAVIRLQLEHSYRTAVNHAKKILERNKFSNIESLVRKIPVALGTGNP
jgi:hypothetical protein